MAAKSIRQPYCRPAQPAADIEHGCAARHSGSQRQLLHQLNLGCFRVLGVREIAVMKMLAQNIR